jgi:phytoene synthase
MTADHRRAELVVHARDSIARGSKSFALASRLFDRPTRERMWLLYAWCRACDDIADDQDMGGRLGIGTPGNRQFGSRHAAQIRLATIRERTHQALAGRATADPAFDGFALVARECGLSQAMADDVIAGFALDAADWQPHSERDLLRYCYHVAGAVGVMAAVVMGVDPSDDDTLDRACDLGLAFQLANIARDLEEDDAAERCYLPADWLAEADIPPGEHLKPHYRTALLGLVSRLCSIAHAYRCSARIGAGRLAVRQRWAVLAAAGIYGEIAREVERLGAHAWDHRAVVSRTRKLGWVARAGVQAMRAPPRSCREGAEQRLWTRRELQAVARPRG